MTASELFALALGQKCEGKEECHWCSGMCGQAIIHDDPGPAPFSRQKSQAKRPGSRYVCLGCHYYRMKRVTVFYLMGGFLDRQPAQEHSWWITPDGAYALRKEDHQLLWERLLNPPSLFSFSMISMIGTNTKNLIQYACVNDHPQGVDLGTPLQFTIDNTPYVYTVYELQSALESREVVGREAGVRELINKLMPYQGPVKEREPRGRGRPKAEINPLTEK